MKRNKKHCFDGGYVERTGGYYYVFLDGRADAVGGSTALADALELARRMLTGEIPVPGGGVELVTPEPEPEPEDDGLRQFVFTQEQLTLLRAGLKLLEKEYAFDAHHLDDDTAQQAGDVMGEKVADLILGIESRFTGDTISRYLTYELDQE